MLLPPWKSQHLVRIYTETQIYIDIQTQKTKEKKRKRERGALSLTTIIERK